MMTLRSLCTIQIKQFEYIRKFRSKLGRWKEGWMMAIEETQCRYGMRSESLLKCSDVKITDVTCSLARLRTSGF